MTNAPTPSAAEPKSKRSTSWRDRALADARDFIAELEKLRQTKRGLMAQLRRNAGETLPGHGTAWFYDYLRSSRRQRFAEIHFLVATLFDLNRKRSLSGDFGHAVARARTPTNDESLKRRFRILLDAVFDTIFDPLNEGAPWQEGGGELAFRLRQMVKLLASKEIGVDWAQLLLDLSQWSHPDRRVQKMWARSFFTPSARPDGAPEDAAGSMEPVTSERP
jgi:CRISPR system Cascade subunit CasB